MLRRIFASSQINKHSWRQALLPRLRLRSCSVASQAQSLGAAQHLRTRRAATSSERISGEIRQALCAGMAPWWRAKQQSKAHRACAHGAHIAHKRKHCIIITRIKIDAARETRSLRTAGGDSAPRTNALTAPRTPWHTLFLRISRTAAPCAHGNKPSWRRQLRIVAGTSSASAFARCYARSVAYGWRASHREKAASACLTRRGVHHSYGCMPAAKKKNLLRK